MKVEKISASILTLAAVITITQLTLTQAQPTTRTGTCQFNDTPVMQCTLVSDGGTFSITWQDGVSDTYRWIGANADRVNISDGRSGRWHFSDHRNCRDFHLTNVENGNVITFVGDDAAC